MMKFNKQAQKECGILEKNYKTVRQFNSFVFLFYCIIPLHRDFLEQRADQIYF